jgi:aspartyl/glutamyl-tRNA(Asn/Gln) amidotransferase C subunit
VKSKIDIDHVCALTHLHLTEEEKERLFPQMVEIVEWVGKLSALSFQALGGETYSPVSFPLPFRQDKIMNSLTADVALANSPDKNKEFIKVPRVIEEK